MIKCTRCKQFKPENEFYKDKDKGTGFASECKECNIIYMKKYYLKNSEKVKAYQKKYNHINRDKVLSDRVQNRKKKLSAWEGLIPISTQCQMCGKKIYFNGRDTETAIHFDHRNGGEELIKGTPSVWLKDNPRTPENEAIWKKCKFGMLCQSCNRALPTKNRMLFLENATKYIKGV
jgi:hypothetical protein